MSAIWFYRPTTLMGRAAASLLGRRIVHVSILHAVANVAVVTEAHPWRGVYCMPASAMKPPTSQFFLEIPDGWITDWLVRRWGVRFAFFDAIGGRTGVGQKPGAAAISSADLVAELLRDAHSAGAFAGAPLSLLHGADRMTPSTLADALKL
jgi:hypothetical protein